MWIGQHLQHSSEASEVGYECLLFAGCSRGELLGSALGAFTVTPLAKCSQQPDQRIVSDLSRPAARCHAN